MSVPAITRAQKECWKRWGEYGPRAKMQGRLVIVVRPVLPPCGIPTSIPTMSSRTHQATTERRDTSELDVVLDAWVCMRNRVARRALDDYRYGTGAYERTHRGRECVYAVRDRAASALRDQGDGIAQLCKFGLGIRRPGCVGNINIEHGDE
ncbi:hypothetical protein BC827DRAFT_1156310 [Russula dissimulans]|nr:hypothetical protein BC827DRAFT_1156310 [Russula dissimulans]